jgi:uncharacterized protein YfkK (UPF0435 family)
VSSGAIGGLLFGIRDKQLELPRYVKADAFDANGIGGYLRLGVIADLVFGTAGGIIIFILLPSIPDINDQWGLIKIVSLSMIGGYSGRAVVEKVASEQLKKTEEKVSFLEERIALAEQQEKNSANALQVIYQVINHKRNYEKSELESIFSNVPSDVLVHGFGIAEIARKQIVVRLLGSERARESEIQNIKERLPVLIPLVAAIISIEEKSDKQENREYIHFHYASLGYLYKDIANPDWNLALEFIQKAIAAHREVSSEAPTLSIYRFNLFLCHVNLIPANNEGTFEPDMSPGGNYHNNEALRLFDEFIEEGGEIFDMLIKSKEILAPKLHKWVSIYRCKEVRSYIGAHKKLPAEYSHAWDKYFEHFRCPESNEQETQ